MDKTSTAPGRAPDIGGADPGEGFAPPSLEFEMALELAGGDDRTWTEVVQAAAEASGGDLVSVLPTTDEDGEVREQAIVRLVEPDGERLVFVSEDEGGLSVRHEGQVEDGLADFAHASVAVLERIRDDERIREPLAADRPDPAIDAA